MAVSADVQPADASMQGELPKYEADATFVLSVEAERRISPAVSPTVPTVGVM